MARPRLHKLEGRPCLPFKYLNVLQGYSNTDPCNTLELEAPGPLFAPCDLHLIDYQSDLSGEVLIVESDNYFVWRDKSENRFTMALRQNKHNGFEIKEHYAKGDSLGYINASHLFLEITEGQFSGYDYHLNNSVEADSLFIVNDVFVKNNGQPVYKGRPLHWKGMSFTGRKEPHMDFHTGDRVIAKESDLAESKEQFGEKVYYVSSLQSYMGKDYLKIAKGKISLLPSIIADLKEEQGKTKALINGYWIDTDNLIKRSKYE